MRPRLGYLQARVQARYAGLPAPAEWQRLEPVRGLAPYLEEARVSPLGPWVAGISASTPSDDIELRVRRLLLDAVQELGRWIGPDWRPALTWTAWLLDLPLIDHWQRQGALPDWVGQDARLASLLRPGSESSRHDAAGTELAELVGESTGSGGLVESWLEGWRRRLAHRRVSHRKPVELLWQRVAAHRDSFVHRPVSETWAARENLDHQLRALFRRLTLQPAAAFCYLMLMALALERLRAGLVKRALFSETESGA